MPKAVLMYNLEDYDDKMSHARAVKALDLVLAIGHIRDRLHHYAKYDTELHFEQQELFEILDQYGIDLDKLIV